ncbi:MAG TPA: hypothetical protein VGB45_04625 [Abditibacterium sp.]
MKECPACKYLMEDFDAVCPRCKGKGLAPLPPPPPPTKSAQMKAEFLATDKAPERIGGASLGGLVFIVPAIIVAILFAFHISINTDTKMLQSGEIPFLGRFIAVPFLALCGAGIGAWLGSGHPTSSGRSGAMIGVAASLVLALLAPIIESKGWTILTSCLFVLLFLGTLAAGAFGGGWHARYNAPDATKLLLGQAGTVLLCFLFPLIGFLVAISLGKNGIDYASPALYGSIAGFLLIGLPFL